MNVNTDTMRLDRATGDDLAFIMSTERLAGYDQLVGRWGEEQHRAALADARYAYFVGRRGTDSIGFAIVRDWAAPERVAHIKRIAVCYPGRGDGRRLLGKLVETIFRATDAYRISLGVFPENIRGRRAYEAVGFTKEGIARGSAFFGGEHRDEVVMALLRPEWTADR